jgi:hypothetical protein
LTGAFLAGAFLAGAFFTTFLAGAFFTAGLALFLVGTRGTLCPFTTLRHPRHAFGAREDGDGLDWRLSRISNSIECSDGAITPERAGRCAG